MDEDPEGITNFFSFEKARNAAVDCSLSLKDAVRKHFRLQTSVELAGNVRDGWLSVFLFLPVPLNNPDHGLLARVGERNDEEEGEHILMDIQAALVVSVHVWPQKLFEVECLQEREQIAAVLILALSDHAGV